MLVVALDSELRALFGPALDRAEFEVDSVTGAGSATELARATAFDLVLPAIDELLAAVRRGVRGEAEVVRHATRPRDAVDGLGVRFLTFRAGDEARLTAFLAKHFA